MIEFYPLFCISIAVCIFLHSPTYSTSIQYQITLAQLKQQERGWCDHLLVFEMEEVTAVQEPVAPCHPFLLDQALEASQGPVVRVQHQLDQAGDDAAQVRAALLWKTKNKHTDTSSITLTHGNSTVILSGSTQY